MAISGSNLLFQQLDSLSVRLGELETTIVQKTSDAQADGEVSTTELLQLQNDFARWGIFSQTASSIIAQLKTTLSNILQNIR